MAGKTKEGTNREGAASRGPSTPVSGRSRGLPNGAGSQPAQVSSTQDNSVKATTGASNSDGGTTSSTPKPNLPTSHNPDEADNSFSSSVGSSNISGDDSLIDSSTFSPSAPFSSPVGPPTPGTPKPGTPTPTTAIPPSKSWATIVAAPPTKTSSTPTPSRSTSEVRGRRPGTPIKTPSRPVSAAAWHGPNSSAPTTPAPKSSSVGPGGARDVSRGRGGRGGSRRSRPPSLHPLRTQPAIRDEEAPSLADQHTLDALRRIWRDFARTHHVEGQRRHSKASASEETPSTVQAFFEDAIAQLAAEIARRDADLERTRSEAGRTRSERQNTTAELEKVRSELEKTTVALEKTRSKREKTQLELEQAEADLGQTVAERDQLLKDKESLEKAMKEKDAKIQEVTDKAEKAKRAHESRCNELNEALKQKEAEIQEVTTEASEAKQVHQSSYDKLNAALKEKDSRIQELTTEAEKAEKAHQSSYDELNDTLKQRNAEIQQMTAEAEKTKKAHESLLKELKEKDEQIQKAVDEVREAKQSCEASRTELSQALKAKDKAANEAREAAEARDAAYDECEKTEKTLTECEKVRDHAFVELQETVDELKGVRMELDAKDIQLQRSTKTISDLQQKSQDEPSADVEELKAKIDSLRDSLRREQGAKDAADKIISSLRLRWQQEEAKFQKNGEESDRMILGCQQEADGLRDEVDRLRDQLNTANGRAAAAAAVKPPTPVFLVDNEKIPLSKYEKLLGNARGENAHLKRQLQEAKQEREITNEIPPDMLRDVLEPYLRLYGIAFDHALEAMERGLQKEDEALAAFVDQGDLFQSDPDDVDASDVEKAPSQASSSALRRGQAAPALSEYGSQSSQASEASPGVSRSLPRSRDLRFRDLRSELNEASLSRQTSTLSDMVASGARSDEGLTLAKCRGIIIRENQRCKDMQAKEKEMEAEVEKLKKDVKRLKKSISVHEKAAEQLRRQLDRATADKAAQQKELDAAEKTIAVERERFRATETRLNAAIDSRNLLQGQIEVLQTELGAWQDSGDQVGKDNVALEKAIADKDEKIAELEANLSKARYDYNSERDRRREAENGEMWDWVSGQALRAKEEEIKRLQAALESQQEEEKKYEAEIGKLKAAKADIQRALDAANEKASRARDSARDAVTQTENISDGVMRLLRVDDQIIDLLQQVLAAMSPGSSVSIGSSSIADITDFPPEIEDPSIRMDAQEQTLFRMGELASIRSTMGELRKAKEEEWYRARGPTRPYDIELLEVELGTLEERLMAARSGHREPGDPANSEEALTRAKDFILARMEQWEQLYRERQAVIGENIYFFGNMFNERFRDRHSPRPLEAPPPTPAARAPSTVEDAPLPPDPRPKNSRDKWSREPTAYDRSFADASSSSDDSDSGSDEGSRPQAASKGYKGELDKVHFLLDRLNTSINVSMHAAAEVRAINDELVQEVADDGTTATVVRRASFRSMDGSSTDLASSSPPSSAGNALSSSPPGNGSSSVFSREKGSGHLVSIFPLRMGTALDQWYKHATQASHRIAELSDCLEILAQHRANVDNNDFLRSTVRKLVIELQEAKTRLRGQTPQLKTERETHLLSLIQDLKDACEKLRARLVERERLDGVNKHNNQEIARLTADNMIKDMMLKAFEEDMETKLEKRVRLVDYMNDQLKTELVEAVSRAQDLQQRLDREVATKAKPVNHLNERIRALEGKAVQAERHRMAAEDARRLFLYNMEQAAKADDRDFTDGMHQVITNSFNPVPIGERALREGDLLSNDQADDEDPRARELRNMKNTWLIQEDRFLQLEDMLKEQAKKHQEEWDEAREDLVADRDARLVQRQAELDLSESNRVEAMEKIAERDERIQQLEKEVAFAYEVREAGRGSGSPGSSSSSSSSSAGSDGSLPSPQTVRRDRSPEPSPEADDAAPPPPDEGPDERASPDADDAADPPAEQPEDTADSPPVQPDEPEAAQDEAVSVTDIDSPPASASGRSTSSDLGGSTTSAATSGLRSRKRPSTEESGNKVTTVVVVEEEPVEAAVPEGAGGDTQPPAANPQGNLGDGAAKGKKLDDSYDDDLKKPTKREKLAYIGGWLTVRASLTDEEAQRYTVAFAWSLSSCLRNHFQAWIWSLWFLVVCAAYVPMKILGLSVDVKAQRPRPKHLAVLLVDMVTVVGLVMTCRMVFATRAVRELWEMANGATRAYYIESRLKPDRSRFLGFNNIDARLFPGYDEASNVASSFARTVFRRPVAATAAARVE
ncbi:hypothetical protein CPLU01_02207 [Colletotrichum plurivorum]|uniref:Uncharacterized protein n=1 Tax=Colletotrichum plurivorum TaxID=2175906 RepID=A0A8H6NMC4_9PEZI|nr:hypothetical protein CPLU01_02207 [Colletotrichum plurivorum]